MTCSLIALSVLLVNAVSLSAEPATIGSRRELFVDDALVERLGGKADLRLHQPTPQNVVFTTDASWEGNGTNYVTVFRDGTKYRMYYRGSHYSYLGGKDRPNTRDLYCYAESPDGIHWTKPELGLFAWNGSKQNNIVWDGVGSHAFVPFRDTNPKCAPDATYKALGVGGKKHGLYAFKSADGIRWTLMRPDPVITKGAFDSHNLAFWDAERGEYREYHRDFRDGRDIRTSTSQDFVQWTEPEFLSYSANVDPGRRGGQPSDVKDPVGAKYPAGRVSELYTNQIAPYYRAPHLLLGFPTRYIDRGWTESAKALPRHDYRQVRAKNSPREGTALTDGMFITSRDRKHFSVWPESFVRPGLRTRDSWFYGDAYQNWGLVETKSDIDDAPPELSLYVTERTGREAGAALRRYTLRIDGFVSLHAPLAGGELVTTPVIFSGNQLVLNVSTSAAGAVRVEIQNAEGQPLPGFALADCHEVYGDDLERIVAWKGNPNLGGLAGKPVRLRFEVRDADLYSYCLQQAKDSPAGPRMLSFEGQADVVLRKLSPDFCWFHPRVAALPGFGKEGQPAVIMTIQKHLVADDHYSGLYFLRTDDLGKTWTGPTEVAELAWQQGPNQETIAVCDVTPGLHAKSGKLIAVGTKLRYSSQGRQLLDQPRSHECAYAAFDPRTNHWTPWKMLAMPETDGKFFLVAPGCVQWLVQPDGTLLVPIYFKGPTGSDYASTVLHCTFDGQEMKYLKHGDELAMEGGRGLCEPSLALFQGKYYLTLRNDARAYVTTSPDGMHFNPVKPWTFDDGKDLGSYNTQAHWLVHTDGLFLTYTRRGANNDHIARSRAPIFIAQVDPATLHVMRKTERALLPERGVMLGNFGAAAVTPNESWVTDAEFISRLVDPAAGTRPHPRGADGTVWLGRVKWSKPNDLAR